MKKILALVLSLIMMMTSVFIAPFSAQADESGNTTSDLPISGTENVSFENQFISDYNWKYDIRYYKVTIPSACTFVLNINATLAGDDDDGVFSISLTDENANYSLKSGLKGYVNETIEYDLLAGDYTFRFVANGNDCPVNCTFTTSFTKKTQSFYADKSTKTSNLAKANEIKLDTMYYGLMPGSTRNGWGGQNIGYKLNFSGGDLFILYNTERNRIHTEDYYVNLYDENGKTIYNTSVWDNEKQNYVNTVGDCVYFKNLKAGLYFISFKDFYGQFNFLVTNDLSQYQPQPPMPEPVFPQPTAPTPTQPTQATTTQTATKIAKPKKAKIKKVKGYKKALEVRYAKISGASGYQIQVATDKKFKKNKKTVTAKKSKTKVKISKLKKKKKYYVRVRAYKTVSGKKVYGAWSKVKTVKTK